MEGTIVWAGGTVGTATGDAVIGSIVGVAGKEFGGDVGIGEGATGASGGKRGGTGSGGALPRLLSSLWYQIKKYRGRAIAARSTNAAIPRTT